MQAKISDLMTTEVICVEPEEPLYEAFQTMREYNFRHLPVVMPKTNKLLGLLSEGDILLHCQNLGEELEINSKSKVQEAMTSKVVFCYPTSDVANVAATLIAGKINSIPVLNNDVDRELLGIVTVSDFLNQLCISQEMSGKAVDPIISDQVLTGIRSKRKIKVS